ncbi:6-phosphogluconate dehydrogenase, decarboxylating [Trichinella pseudospiralis]|uniref:6-phosphogluconate dehydrogenase, decarboxylating n=1 Tax=Trichinella pseudospiralis TaxID=6337 RepID=A0A0V1EQC3_TRIPS|nr:6-phosphogluconate dehydrogenase, decarboxylating [Trichinella pseudospiralis]KRZ23319.1 6-phosphogluconate dehydrogenase, decarboxylating [Trichinella pseudospiralis]KRZ28714.1 6-phosphogluconate dehydrogenase, decarboxylating [Trichinella pseudospiralis]
MTMPVAEADIAVIGLAVMGQNLILNMNDKGYVVCAFNRTVSKVDDFLNNEARGTRVVGAHSLEEMAACLKRPRRVMLMVKAGSAVDDFIDKLLTVLEKGDIIIDGGNSEYHDTQRRYARLKEHGMHYVGCGVSGGEDGARNGPSLMPGGAVEAWPHLKPIFQSIAAKVDDEPCCDWVGSDGAGHYVKMVHNGIEYGDMQLISESYQFLRDVIGLNHDQMADVFDRWNRTELDSYLVELTATVLRVKDKDGDPLVTKILDSAGQKGTGKWTAVSALDLGIPLSSIAEAVFARCLSALVQDRKVASVRLPASNQHLDRLNVEQQNDLIEHLRKALYVSKIVSYAQGFMMLQRASAEYKWNLDYGKIALMWRGGCIIRSVFLNRIKQAFDRDTNIHNLLFDQFFSTAVKECQDSWRTIVSKSALLGIPMPAFASTLAFYDGFRCVDLPASLLQALRDGFGAHTYQRKDNVGVFVHSDWTGHGGRTASSNYEV